MKNFLLGALIVTGLIISPFLTAIVALVLLWKVMKQ